jgi:hypothetical protein
MLQVWVRECFWESLIEYDENLWEIIGVDIEGCNGDKGKVWFLDLE